MIRNIIFDIGMVLVHFRWDDLMQELGITGEAFDVVSKATVLGPYWNEFDRSKLTGDEIIEMCCKLAPGYEEQVRLFFAHTGELCYEHPWAAGWIQSFKDAGYKTYLLSNYARLSYTSVQPPYRFASVVDGGIISYEVQEIKPEPAIYHILLDKYKLKAEECVFIDDNPANIDTARKLGFYGIVHRSKTETDQELQKLGVSV